MARLRNLERRLPEGTESRGTVAIDEATTADIPAIEALLRDTGMSCDGVAGQIDNFVVAREGGRLVGVAGLEPCGGGIAMLRSLAVPPSHRRRGIAERLCERLTARAHRAGITDLYLLTITARGYFERLGFIAVAREKAPAAVRASRQFRNICPASAQLMRRRLGA